ncbi:uncharacterized protein METZ01_LOCUS153523 [marine metagenome]|uniref:Uncharacterized protein n=1 Tax=marine metagenome TaxID=408172 RepID=A0A382AH16_9ZZZZ
MLLTHSLAHEEERRHAGRRFDVGYKCDPQAGA